MQKYIEPTKEDIRKWLAEHLDLAKPLPDLEEIRKELWHIEKTRKQVLS